MADYYIIKMFPVIPQRQLEFLTGGWMPVSQIVGSGAAACIFTDRSNAEKYKTSYEKISAGQIKRLEIESMSVENIRKFKIISDKLAFVAVDPVLEGSQFNAAEIMPIDELVT